MESSEEQTLLNVEQQFDQLVSKVEKCVAVIEELRIERQLLLEQVEMLNDRNKQALDAVQRLIQRLDVALCHQAQ